MPALGASGIWSATFWRSPGAAREAEDRQSRAGREAGVCTPQDSRRVRSWEPHAAGQVRSAAAVGPVRGAPRYLAGRGSAPLPSPPELGASCRWGAESPLAGAVPSARRACAGRRAPRGPPGRRALPRTDRPAGWPAGGGHAFGCGRAGFGPGLPWQPLAGPGAPRPPARRRRGAGSARCAPSGLNQALGRRGEGRPRSPLSPSPLAGPRKGSRSSGGKENPLVSGLARRLARARGVAGRGSGVGGMSPPSGSPCVRLSLDIFYPTAADSKPGCPSQPRSSVGGAGFNLLISNDFRSLALKWRHWVATRARGSPRIGATSRSAAFASVANRWHVPLPPPPPPLRAGPLSPWVRASSRR